MEETVEKMYNFRSKIYVTFKKGKLKRFLLKFGIVVTIILSISMLIEGKSLLRAGGQCALFLGALIPALHTSKGKFKLLPGKIKVYEDKLIILYESIDREDEKGGREEKYIIPYSDIQLIEIDRNKECLSIISHPFVEITYSDNKKEEYNFKELNKQYTNDIYMTEVVTYQFINDVKSFSDIQINEVR